VAAVNNKFLLKRNEDQLKLWPLNIRILLIYSNIILHVFFLQIANNACPSLATFLINLFYYVLKAIAQPIKIMSDAQG